MRLIVKPYGLKHYQAGGDTWGATTSLPGTPHLPKGTWVWGLKLADTRGKWHFDGHLNEEAAHELADAIERGEVEFVQSPRPMRIFGSNSEAKEAARRDGRLSPEMLKHRKLYGKS